MAAKNTSAQGKLAALQSFRDDVEELRARRLDLVERIQSVHSAPVSKAEVAGRVKAALDHAESEARGWASFESFSSSVDLDFDVGTAFKYTPLGLLSILGMRETFESKLLSEALASSTGERLDSAVRESTVAKLEGELGDVERAEEAAIREAEAAGAYIVRRTDADPALYLAESV